MSDGESGAVEFAYWLNDNVVSVGLGKYAFHDKTKFPDRHFTMTELYKQFKTDTR